MKMNLAGIGVIAAAGMMLSPMASAVESITDAFKEGKAGVSFRLRYEDVDQPEKDMSADALTLRSRLSFQTADFYGSNARVTDLTVRIASRNSSPRTSPPGSTPTIRPSWRRSTTSTRPTHWPSNAPSTNPTART